MIPTLLCVRLDDEGLASIIEISDAITLLCQQVRLVCPQVRATDGFSFLV